jgi:hypothetical protein
MRTHSERNADAHENDANHKPITNNQEPVKEKKKNSKSSFDPLEMELPENLSFDSWQAWIAYRKSAKIKTAEATFKSQLAFLAEQGDDANAVIEQTIRNGWQGLFELKNKPTTAKPSGKPSYDDGRKRDYGEGGLI